MIAFEKTVNNTVIVTQDGVVFGLPGDMYVIPTRYNIPEYANENTVEISNGAYFQFIFDWRDVTTPVAGSRNELITELITNFFFKLTTGGGNSGIGDVIGPSSSLDNAIVRYNLTTGKSIQNSSVLLDDSGRLNSYPSTALPNTTITADSIAATLSRSIKWTIVCENGAVDLLMQEILVWNDNTLPIFSEYGIIDKGTGLDDLVIDVDLDSGNLRLRIQNLSLTKTYDVRTSRFVL